MNSVRSLLVLALTGAAVLSQALIITFSGRITSASRQTQFDQYPYDLDPSGMTFSGTATERGIRLQYSFGFQSIELQAFRGLADADDLYNWFHDLTKTSTGFEGSYYEDYLPLYYPNGTTSPTGGDYNRYQVSVSERNILFQYDANYEGTFPREETFRGVVTSYSISDAPAAPGPLAAVSFGLLALKRRKRA